MKNTPRIYDTLIVVLRQCRRDSVLACVGEFDGVLVKACRLTGGQVGPAPALLGVQTATVVLWAFRRPQHPDN